MKQKQLLQKLDLSCFVAFDFETTGLDHHNDRIIEVAAIKFVDGEITERYVELVNPEMNLLLSLRSRGYQIRWYDHLQLRN